MSYSTRDRAQRKLGQAAAALDKALVYVAEVAIEYDSHTPVVAEACEALGTAIETVNQMVTEVRQSF